MQRWRNLYFKALQLSICQQTVEVFLYIKHIRV